MSDNALPLAPKCLAILEGGITSLADFQRAMLLLAADVAARRLTPQQANAITNAAGKTLKAEDLYRKHNRRLALGDGDGAAAPAPAVGAGTSA